MLAIELPLSILRRSYAQAPAILTPLAVPEVPPDREWDESEEGGSGFGPEIEVQLFFIGTLLILAGLFSENYMVGVFLTAAGVLMLWVAIRVTFG